MTTDEVRELAKRLLDIDPVDSGDAELQMQACVDAAAILERLADDGIVDQCGKQVSGNGYLIDSRVLAYRAALLREED